MVLLQQQTSLILRRNYLALHSNLDLTSLLQTVHLQASRSLWRQLELYHLQSNVADLYSPPRRLPVGNGSPCQAGVSLTKGLRHVHWQNCVFSLALFLKQAIKWQTILVMYHCNINWNSKQYLCNTISCFLDFRLHARKHNLNWWFSILCNGHKIHLLHVHDRN